MKKLCVLLCSILTAASINCVAFAADNLFENDLFDVLGEVSVDKYYDIVDPEDNVITDARLDFYNVENQEKVFNDGLTWKNFEDEYRYSYLNSSGEEVYPIDDKGFTFMPNMYNLGYVVVCTTNTSNDDLFNTYIDDLYDSETGVFGYSQNNRRYKFNNVFFYDGFDDNGYAYVEDLSTSKFYKIRLKSCTFPTVQLNGQKLMFDQIPVIDNGRTLVPLRKIFEALGAEINWDEATRTVTAVKGDTEIKLTIDNTTAYKNGEAISLDVPGKIVNSRTMVPVRFIADCFGVNVDWDGNYYVVKLTSK